ncbi:MAG TPA: glycosyltransferase family 39 protein [Jatrophihabitans sp.]|nr:glycosyltransferase family 39 protein [Jatrophihabitans sp.]
MREIRRSRIQRSLGDERLQRLAGALASLGIAIAMFSRYSLSGTLSRDEGIYVYGGQQLAHHGTAPYVSIFDPKGPLADMLCALGAVLAGPFGLRELTAIRLLFAALSAGTVVALYLFAQRIFGSVLAGVAAAAVLSSFDCFANDAVQGPDAKTPAIFCVVLAMWLATHRRWLWVGVLSGLAVLTWQPMFTYPVVFAACALLLPEAAGRRVNWQALGRLLLGIAAPLVAVAIYFAADGAFGRLWTAAIVFPLTGVRRGSTTFASRAAHIQKVIDHHYHGAALIWIGGILLVAVTAAVFVRNGREWRAALADPIVCIAFATGVLQVGYVLVDFQGYPDTLPLLPYPALGIAGTVALVLHAARRVPTSRRAAEIAVAGLTAVLVVFAWSWLEHDKLNDHGLHAELADACALHLSLGPSQQLLSLGYPPALVLTGRTNPSPYIYLDSGVAVWKAKHTPGGFSGWLKEIAAGNPGAVVIDGWKSPRRTQVRSFLHEIGYHPVHFGGWLVFLDDAARARAKSHDIALSRQKSAAAHTVDGKMLPGYSCLSANG